VSLSVVKFEEPHLHINQPSAYTTVLRVISECLFKNATYAGPIVVRLRELALDQAQLSKCFSMLRFVNQEALKVEYRLSAITLLNSPIGLRQE
jgi:hypothetical protein